MNDGERLRWVVEAEKAEIMNAYNEEVNQPTAYHLFTMRIHYLSFFHFHCTHRATTSQLKPQPLNDMLFPLWSVRYIPSHLHVLDYTDFCVFEAYTELYLISIFHCFLFRSEKKKNDDRRQ